MGLEQHFSTFITIYGLSLASHCLDSFIYFEGGKVFCDKFLILSDESAVIGTIEKVLS